MIVEWGLLVSWMGLVNEAYATSNQCRTYRFKGAAELSSVELIRLISCCPDKKWRISGIGLFLNNKKGTNSWVLGHGGSNPGLPATSCSEIPRKLAVFRPPCPNVTLCKEEMCRRIVEWGLLVAVGWV
jgi:hypothetical protein